jgi:SAM-dependent methyltransferase
VSQEKLVRSILEDVKGPPEDLSAEDALRLLTALWKQLMLHDEVTLALGLLDCAPWKIRDGQEVASMRALTEAACSHMRDLTAYRSMYSEYASGLNGVEAIPMPNEVKHEYSQWPRYNLLEGELRKAEQAGKTISYLDVGSHDGWLTNRAGMRGHRCYGIEACTAYVSLANQKAAEFRTGARHESCFFMLDPHPESFPGKYDLVSCFEVYEHVPDTGQLMASLKNMLNPGGRLILSTPRGSWLQGLHVSYHEAWDLPSPREHVRAPTVGDVRKDAETAGLRVVSVKTSEGDWASPNVPGQAFILLTAELPS